MKNNDSKWIRYNNIALWTESFGQRNHPTVLLVIGAGAVSTFYTDHFCNQIAKSGFFVIRYDQRDYGYSTHFKQIDPKNLADKKKLQQTLPYRIEDLVEDAREILDAHQVTQAHLVGHSMGGMIAQLFTAVYPTRLLSFTSISAGPASHQVTLEPISPEVMDLLLSNQPKGDFERDISGWLRSFKLLNGEVEFDEDMARKYVQEIYHRDPCPGVAWNHIGIQQLLPNYFETFRKNKLRGLILHGEADLLQPVSYAQEAHKMISHTQLVTLPKVGHMFFNTNTENQILECLITHCKYEL